MQGKVLITGSSSGIGKATALRFQKAGYAVIGTSRNPGAIAKEDLIPGIEYHQLELTDDASIARLIPKLGDTHILINNAGSSQIGPTETVPIDRIEYLFRVNFFGPLKLIQAVLPAMRMRRAGRIVNVTSMAGKWALPYSSVYAATKFALEGAICGMREEVKPWGIKIVNVAPTAVHTQIEQEVQFTDGSPYFEMARQMKKRRDRFIDTGPEPDIIASVVEKAAVKKHPRTWYPAGNHANLMCLLLRMLPIQRYII